MGYGDRTSSACEENSAARAAPATASALHRSRRISSEAARPEVMSRSSSIPMAPGRSTVGGTVVRSSTVDSTPTSIGPPSSTMSMRPFRSSSTCDARVGLGRENRLALGAAMGSRAAARSACATGWAGILIATVSSPAVTSRGHRCGAAVRRASGAPARNVRRARPPSAGPVT